MLSSKLRQLSIRNWETYSLWAGLVIVLGMFLPDVIRRKAGSSITLSACLCPECNQYRNHEVRTIHLDLGEVSNIFPLSVSYSLWEPQFVISSGTPIVLSL